MTAIRALEPAIGTLTSMAGRLIAASTRRRTDRMLARLSSRQLEDMGFARDWDGTVYRPTDLH